MISKFPEIVNTTEEFIKLHGFAAQCRRRTDLVILLVYQ